MDKRGTESKAVEGTLQKPDVHAKWEHDFRAPENATFYDDSMRFIARELDPSVRPRLLDAGCGICDYSIRLAQEGFDVTAVDLAEDVLEAARASLVRASSEGSW